MSVFVSAEGEGRRVKVAQELYRSGGMNQIDDLNEGNTSISFHYTNGIPQLPLKLISVTPLLALSRLCGNTFFFI